MTSDAIRRPRICLNMIVRNEAHVIHELVASVAPHIDNWVIVDTGSTDGTQDVVRRLMAERGLPGELFERPWRDFGHNRSDALALAQGRGDYIWVIDADDTLVGAIDFTGLTADAYGLRIRDRSTYWRLQLFRDGVPWRYEGVLHERAVCDVPHTRQRLEGDYHVQSRRLGERNQDPRKYARDAEILQAEVDRNPEDRRAVFYLAQSYRDAGDVARAKRWYERRAAMGGWAEEVFVSLLMVAQAGEVLGEPWPDVQDAYLRAWNFRPSRAEPLYEIARRHRVAGQHQIGHLFAERAARIPLPVQDELFVPGEIYAWRALDEQAVCASWIGRMPECFAICRRLLASADLPAADRGRIAANRDLAVPEMLATATAAPEDLPQVVRGPAADVTVTLVAGPDRAAFEHTLASLVRSCLDRDRIARVIVLDAGLSADDRRGLGQRHPWLEFATAPAVPEPLARLVAIRRLVEGHFWLHVEAGWRFFAPERLLTRLTEVLEAEPAIVQVGVNHGDAERLTGTCPPENAVRRTATGGRYVVTSGLIHGPSLVHLSRFDTGVPLWQSGAAAVPAATLDEVLCLPADGTATGQPPMPVPHAIRPSSRPTLFIGLGHPRCGTGFTASLLQANGVDVRHEEVGPEGIVSWMQVAKRGPAPWGNTLSAYPAGARVFLVARSPLAALDAVATENQQIRSIGLRSQLLWERRRVDLFAWNNQTAGDGIYDYFGWAVASLAWWYDICFDDRPEMVFRIEHPEDDALLGRLVGRPISREGKHVWQNTYGPHKKSGRLEFPLDELRRVPRNHLAKLVEVAERLGYPADAATLRGYL